MTSQAEGVAVNTPLISEINEEARLGDQIA